MGVVTVAMPTPRTSSRRETKLLAAARAVVEGGYPPTLDHLDALIEAVDAYEPRHPTPEKFPSEHGIAGGRRRGGS